MKYNPNNLLMELLTAYLHESIKGLGPVLFVELSVKE
jgi:hypothetical protein